MVAEVMVMEEKNNVSKNRWKRLIKKKWFFPAVYLVVAALLLTGVLWYQNLVNQTNDIAEDMKEQFTNHNKTAPSDDEDAAPVMQSQEVLQMPIAEDLQVEVVTKFYDYNASEEEQQKGLIFYQNKFSQSKGIDIASTNNDSFEVRAALSGKVVEVDQDPLLGKTVKIEHEEGITTYYASLDEIMIEEGSNVAQGQSIGTAGTNAMGEENGVHVHFQVRKDGTPVNPENFINQPISKIVTPGTDEDDSSESEESEEDNNDETSNSEEEAPKQDDEQEDTEESA